MTLPFPYRVIMMTLAITAFLSMLACGSKNTGLETKSLTLTGQKVSFAAPPEASWKMTTQEVPRANNASPSPAASDTIIRYTPTWKNGFITISGLGDWELTSWEQDPEKTNELVRTLQDQILKRADSKIIKQEETKLGKETALLLDFTYTEASTPMHGMQIFAIHNKTFVSIALTTPQEHYAECENIFNHMMTSFRFEEQ